MKKAKILIVDDRPENLLVLESLIDDPKIELLKATSGMDALGYTLDHELALVLLDVNMPEMDGYEVAELMRGNKLTRNIPIIFVTAEHKEKAHIFKGYDSGAVDYLFKPLEPAVLLGKIKIFLELFYQREALEEKSAELNRRLGELQDLQQQLEETNQQLTLLSTTDGLTGLYNRRRFDEIFLAEWKRGTRNNQPLSILLVDIDHFKNYNDRFGHLCGDATLKTVANKLKNTARKQIDTIARYGGEEFIAILPETDSDGAMKIAERMRIEIEGLAISNPIDAQKINITVSIGVATIVPSQSQKAVDLIAEADKNLYKAKAAGRNCSRK